MALFIYITGIHCNMSLELPLNTGWDVVQEVLNFFLSHSILAHLEESPLGMKVAHNGLQQGAFSLVL